MLIFDLNFSANKITNSPYGLQRISILIYFYYEEYQYIQLITLP